MKIKIHFNKKTPMIAVGIAFIVFAIILVALAQTAQPREILAEWKPETRPRDMSSHNPNTGTDANTAARLTRSNAAVVPGGAGGTRKDDPRFSYYTRGWNAEGQYWQISGVSTQGYERIELSFATRGSNTGPKNFALEYSTDGTTWRPLRDGKNVWIAYTIAENNRFQRHGPYELSSAINNLEILHFRFANTDEESVIGDTTKSSGTNYIADITLSGIAMSDK